MAAIKHKLLVIDDDPEIIELLQLLLCEAFELTVCLDAREALAQLPKSDYRGILIDLKMPQMHGKELIRIIRATGSQVPIIIMTGHSENDPEVKEAMVTGGVGVLTKPFRDINSIPEQIGKLIKL